MKQFIQYLIEDVITSPYKLQKTDMVIPIEVKYQTSTSRSDYKNLITFMEQYKLDMGILVIRDLLDIYENNRKYIRLIPVWWVKTNEDR